MLAMRCSCLVEVSYTLFKIVWRNLFWIFCILLMYDLAATARNVARDNGSYANLVEVDFHVSLEFTITCDKWVDSAKCEVGQLCSF